MINPITGRVHTSYNQAVAATGRLSSTNPNLQNIPIRTERGREVRKAFITTADDHVILPADYSQIALRFVPHLSEIGRASCRGKSVSVRVDLGGSRELKKQK